MASAIAAAGGLEAYRRRLPLLDSALDASQRLLTFGARPDRLGSFLAHQCRAVGATRAVLLRIDGDGARGPVGAVIHAHWPAGARHRHGRRSRGADVHHLSAPLVRDLWRGEPLHTDIPFGSCAGPGRTRLLFPVFALGTLWGVLAFGGPGNELRAGDVEVAVLRHAANAIGSLVERQRLQEERRARADAEAAAHASVLAERARIAGRIHDTLAQNFAGVLLHLEALRSRAERGEPVTTADLARVRTIAAHGLAETRRSALVLRPLALDGRDLPTALGQLAERVHVPGALTCTWSCDGTPRRLDPGIEEALLHIALEAVNNAIRHASATRLDLRLAYGVRGVALEVADDGAGLGGPGPLARGRAFGLQSMRERAAAAGAKLEIVSAPGTGTRVRVRWPAP